MVGSLNVMGCASYVFKLDLLENLLSHIEQLNVFFLIIYWGNVKGQCEFSCHIENIWRVSLGHVYWYQWYVSPCLHCFKPLTTCCAAVMLLICVGSNMPSQRPSEISFHKRSSWSAFRKVFKRFYSKVMPSRDRCFGDFSQKLLMFLHYWIFLQQINGKQVLELEFP